MQRIVASARGGPHLVFLDRSAPGRREGRTRPREKSSRFVVRADRRRLVLHAEEEQRGREREREGREIRQEESRREELREVERGSTPSDFYGILGFPWDLLDEASFNRALKRNCYSEALLLDLV